MAKDPALLWYFNDWTGGTVTLSRHLKGCYLDLLAAQFNSGPLSLDEIKTVLGTDFGQAWPTLQKKFVKDDSNCYYNERLQFEKEKRINYSNSRRTNRISYVNHMSSHMENTNENRNINEIKNEYGEFRNVFLTRDEFEKLKTALTEKNTLLLIGELSEYIKSIGKDKYKNHYATLLNWARRKIVEHNNKPTRGKQII